MSAHLAKGFHTATAYPVVSDAVAFIEFLKTVFDAKETFRAVGAAGGIHAEVRLAGSMLMLGGGGPDLHWSGDPSPMAFHVSVPDVDAVYRKALGAGANSLNEPKDQFWGERTANIKDPFGNFWYIGTRQGETYYFEGMPKLQPYLHPEKARPVVEFLTRAFGAEETGRVTLENGRIEHTTIRIGDATIEMTEAQGPFQPMPSTFYVYVQNADESFHRALEAGATSISEPADQPYGDRSGAVCDPFRNRWFLATTIQSE